MTAANWITIAVAVTAAVVSVASFIVNGRHTWRKDTREQEEHQDAEADRTIDLLKEQNSLLGRQTEELKKLNEEQKRQGDARETEWRKREAEWQRREKALETRISEVERDYRNLVLTVTTMGFCASAADCKDYNPGGRRMHAAPDTSPGGTD